MTRPPKYVYDLVDSKLPGFWREFFGKARATFGPQTRVTSWWRNPHANLDVNGVDDSQHLIGAALDLVDPDMRALEARARAAGWGFVLPESDHVHVQAYPASGNLRLFVRWVVRNYVESIA